MRRLVTILFLLVAASAVIAQTKKESDEFNNEEAVMKMEREWSAAFLRHDTAAIDRILSDDFVGTDGRGVVSNKAQELEEATAPAPGSPPRTSTIVDEKLTDMKVRVYGNTAVLNALNTATLLFNGKESMVRYRRTTVWVKRQGRWQCVSFHGSRVLQG